MSQILQGMSAMNAANFNAKAAGQQADAAVQQGVADSARVRDAARYAAGEAVAAQAENGVQIGTGSALDLLRENKLNAELDMMTVRTKAGNTARSWRDRQALAKAEARDALTGALLSTAEQGVKLAAGGA